MKYHYMLVLLHYSLGNCLLALVYTSAFPGAGWCQTLTRTNNFCLEKDKGNKNLEKQSDYREQQMWEKECVCVRFKGEDFSLLFRTPSKALGSA